MSLCFTDCSEAFNPTVIGKGSVIYVAGEQAKEHHCLRRNQGSQQKEELKKREREQKEGMNEVVKQIIEKILFYRKK